MNDEYNTAYMQLCVRHAKMVRALEAWRGTGGESWFKSEMAREEWRHQREWLTLRVEHGMESAHV